MNVLNQTAESKQQRRMTGKGICAFAEHLNVETLEARFDSGEVDISSQPGLACHSNQSKNCRALSQAAAPTDYDDDSKMRLLLGKRNKIIAIAGHQYQLVIESVSQNEIVR